MKYLYGEFTDKQINEAVRVMHNDIHKLLLYKDKKIEETIFNSEEDFFNYYDNLIYWGIVGIVIAIANTGKRLWFSNNANLFIY